MNLTDNSALQLVLNGSFMQRDMVAVRFVALQYLKQISIFRENREYSNLLESCKILAPQSVQRNNYTTNLPIFRKGSLPVNVWQQITLPQLSRGNLLINFCNTGPIMSREAITMIHDAHVFETPDSYSTSFQWYSKIVYKLCGHFNRRIITVSDYSASMLVKHGVCDRSKITVIPNGVDHVRSQLADLSILKRFQLKEQGFVLGLANSQKHKNIDVLLKSFESKYGLRMPLVLYGNHTREKFREQGLSPGRNVIFTGRISDGERRALLEAAICFAFPSTVEGFGFPPAEALAVGCPTITTNMTAIPEVCGSAALYVSPTKPNEWVNAILSFAKSKEMRKKYSEAGKNQVANFTWQSSCKLLLNAIAKVHEEIERES